PTIKRLVISWEHGLLLLTARRACSLKQSISSVFFVLLSDSVIKHSLPTIKRLVISWEHDLLPPLYHICRHTPEERAKI
ncbi:MAG: hypothetical protein O7C60_07015, partial [Rickettsia endosymbiont of Ixodes persulcatus]|nr:hypothetical protein [Rickettsia endosymbiont of Ixodes persulcatus]